MIDILKKNECCGCTACYSVCPKNCIKMELDEEGFIYPSIDYNTCIKCNKCENTCPIINKSKEEETIPDSVVVRDKREVVLKSSTSGGVFTSIMEHFLQMGGVVYGVILDIDNVVKHTRVEDINDKNWLKIPGSKYVKSDIVGIYPQVLADLKNNRQVCFSGTPCQVAGLVSYLGKEYDNLTIVDLICRSNPSPLYWYCFVKYKERKSRSKIKNVRFRNKTYGYHSGSMKIEFQNGKTEYSSARTNMYLKTFFADLCSRPSCYNCSFKSIRHKSDLTLYDCWHASEISNVTDDDMGYTNIIIQSEKGKTLLQRLKNLEIHPADTLKAVELDGIMVKNSIRWSEEREQFFADLSDCNFEKHFTKYCKVSVKDKIIEYMKKYVYWRKYKRFISK